MKSASRMVTAFALVMLPGARGSKRMARAPRRNRITEGVA